MKQRKGEWGQFFNKKKKKNIQVMLVLECQ